MFGWLRAARSAPAIPDALWAELKALPHDTSDPEASRVYTPG